MNEHLMKHGNSQEDFVNMATHELKSPVAILKAYVQMMSLKMNKTGQTEYLFITEKMDSQLDKLLNIISDLQDVTQIRSGSMNYHFSEFNINDSLRNSAEAIFASNPEIEIEFSLCSPDPVIKGDVDRIEQVITNFINNGLKYSRQHKFLKFSSVVEDGYLKVSVADKGMGIPFEKQPDIFKRFFRAGSPEQNKLPGLGLGLFISKEIIDAHLGEIGVDSKVDEGSEFWFKLLL